MGLDIVAYSHLRAMGDHTGGAHCEDEDHVEAYAYDSFPASFQGIPVLSVRENRDGSKFLLGGCYAVTEATETHEFRAGSYSGYGAWRSDLARQFNPAPMTFDLKHGPHMGEPNPEGPFYALIWFADNEGTIGELAAASLFADFRAHAGRYDPGSHAEYFLQKYQDWTRAFELAAQGGLVKFC